MDTILDVAPLSMDRSGLSRDALAGEVAVVTGGSSNIGLGTARSLAWAGAKVVIAARNPQRGEAAAAYINQENKPGTAIFVPTDISDEAAMKNLAQKAFDAFGKVDILVNNAMDMSLGASILKGSVQQMDQQYGIAVRGTLLGIQQFVPGMQERHHGVVTFLASTFCYPRGPSNYCAIKSATTSMLISLANELGPYKDTGVSVFTFIPSSVSRPHQKPHPKEQKFQMAPAMPGYPGPIPPEDCGAALTYSITRAGELHGSGIIIQQAFRQMNWPFPKPETKAVKDWERLSDDFLPIIFAYMGPGFPGDPLPKMPVTRSED